MSLKTHEIIAVSSTANNGDTVSPYPDPAPDEKGLMRSFSLDLDAKEHAGDDPKARHKSYISNWDTFEWRQPFIGCNKKKLSEEKKGP